jgi:hypothetical protein
VNHATSALVRPAGDLVGLERFHFSRKGDIPGRVIVHCRNVTRAKKVVKNRERHSRSVKLGLDESTGRGSLALQRPCRMAYSALWQQFRRRMVLRSG